MFGYVTANPSLLSEEDKVKYRAYYCGLCRKLKEKGKGISSISLNYDMAFLAIILDGVYNKSPEITKGSCGLHFIKGCSFSESEFLSYAADMNILLSSAGCSVSDLLRLFHFQSQADKRFPRRPTLHIELLHSLCDEVSQNIWILSNVWHWIPCIHNLLSHHHAHNQTDFHNYTTLSANILYCRKQTMR